MELMKEPSLLSLTSSGPSHSVLLLRGCPICLPLPLLLPPRSSSRSSASPASCLCVPGEGRRKERGGRKEEGQRGDVWGRKGCQGGVLKRRAGVTEAMTACFLTYSSSAYRALCPVPFFPLFFASSDIIPSDLHPSLALAPSFRLPPFPLRSLLYEE